ncbi:MAG: tetratricopeptide repeat protein, partial [Planctomycetes bacterium]|nr:tetratricopeptide repeat protein [Planctomycetota bacterium]
GGVYALVGEAYVELVRRGDPGRVLALCDEAVLRDPLFPEPFYLRAVQRGLFDIGTGAGGGRNRSSFLVDSKRFYNPAAALDDVRRYLDLDPVSVEGRFMLAALLARRRDFAASREALDAILAMEGEHLDALELRVKLLFAARRYEAALADAERMVELRPQYPRAAFILGSVLLLLGRHEEAERLQTEMLPWCESVRDTYLLHMVRGIARAARSDYPGAREDMEAALAANGDFRRVVAENEVLAPGGPLAAFKGAVVAALADWGREFEIPPERKEGLRLLGRLKEELPQLREALDGAVRANRIDIDLRLLVEALTDPDHGELVRAVDGARAATGLNFNLAEAITVMGYFVVADEEQALLHEDPLYEARDYYRRATFHYRVGRLQEAWDDLSSAVSLEPDFREAHYARATVSALLARGEPAQAALSLGSLRNALVLGWRHLDYAERDPDFATVRETAEFARLARLARATR